MQMLSEFEKFGEAGLLARPRDEAAGGKGGKPAAQELLGSPRATGPGSEARPARHTISLTTAYGNVVAEEEVSDQEYGAALRRIHGEAVSRANSIIVIDGVVHTRNSFLEFVREFNDWAARQQNASARA